MREGVPEMGCAAGLPAYPLIPCTPEHYRGCSLGKRAESARGCHGVLDYNWNPCTHPLPYRRKEQKAGLRWGMSQDSLGTPSL